MLSVNVLRIAARRALAYISAQPDIAEAEVFAAANSNLTLRLNYTSHIPSNGVEEPKSIESAGISVRAVFTTPDGIQTGMGSEPGDLSPDAAARALDKARRSAVSDPEFLSLPQPDGRQPTLTPNPDPTLDRLTNNRLLAHGWNLIEQGLTAFQSAPELQTILREMQQNNPDLELSDLGLILGGDLTLLQERMAIASTSMPQVQSDESTLILSFITAMVEERNAKGSGWSVASHLSDFDAQSAAIAARRAIAAMDGIRLPGGPYRVLLGPQPVAEILEWVLLPGLVLDAFYADASPFMGRLGQAIASPKLSIYDHGAAPGMAGSKAITDEGLPTGRTNLITNGQLTGLLSDYYNFRRIHQDPRAPAKLGINPANAGDALAPRNGFRAGNGGGRDFNAHPTIVPTNLILTGPDPLPSAQLLQLIGDGIYIGRIWYTYAVNGFTAGDFSGTIVGDSWLIKDGKLAAPLLPNTLRLNDNIKALLHNILAVGSNPTPTVRWSSDQVTWAPELALTTLHLQEIATPTPAP